jgi:uncharacterized membrane protein YedE/YeeE
VSRVLIAFGSGLVFALGLGLAGMTRPEKVLGFLDIAGAWDPTLMLVLGAAVGLYTLLYRLVMRRSKPVFEPVFAVPTRRDITPSLVVGGVLFGAGWGLAGFCPGPAITSLASGSASAVAFVGAMVVGMLAFGVFDRWRERQRVRVEANQTPGPIAKSAENA